MEVALSLNPLIRLPSSSSSNLKTREDSLLRHSLFSSRKSATSSTKKHHYNPMMVVEAKSKKGMISRQFQGRQPPPLPKLEDDGNPKFVIFIRMANVYLWYPLNIVTGGTTAKIIVSAKDTFLGKYIYKDTLARNLAAVVYKDEKEMQKMAVKQFRVLRGTTEFRYGYKLVEKNNIRSALAANDVIELPRQDELKTVVDKVKDFFGDAKESFGKLTFLNSGEDDDDDGGKGEADSKEKNKSKAKSL